MHDRPVPRVRAEDQPHYSLHGPRRRMDAAAAGTTGIANQRTRGSARPAFCAVSPRRSREPAISFRVAGLGPCAAPSRVVPRVSTAALPHNSKMLGEPRGVGPCHSRRGVHAVFRSHPRSGWTFSSCVSRRLSRRPRRNRDIGTAYAYHDAQMHRKTGCGRVAGMRRPARGAKARRVTLPRTGLKVESTIYAPTRLARSVGRSHRRAPRGDWCARKPSQKIRRS